MALRSINFSSIKLTFALLALIMFTHLIKPRGNSTLTGNKHCLKLNYASPPLPITILASAPGSGNTWLRHLVQEATGYLTGSLFNDTQLLKEFPAQGVIDGSVVLVKAHLAKSLDEITNCSRVILLVRNLFRAIISDYHRRVTAGNHTGIAPEKFLAWRKIDYKWVERWYFMIAVWLKRWKGPMLVVSYEDLVKHTEGEVKKIIDFLELEVNSDRLSCMLQNSEGHFHRQPTPLKPEMFSDIKNVTDTFTFYVDLLNTELMGRFGVKIDDTIPFELTQQETMNQTS